MEDGTAGAAAGKEALRFACWAADGAALDGTALLAASLRRFGGRFAAAPVHVLAPGPLLEAPSRARGELLALGVRLREVAEPTAEEAWWFYGGKARAAAQAEEEAAGRAEILAWLDDDTVLLDEPAPLLLPEGVDLGWRPVMHRNVGTPVGDGPGPIWERICRRLDTDPAALFPVRTVADDEEIRCYLNAGCLALRPRAGLLARWSAAFSALAGDGFLHRAARDDSRWRIFLHQAALSVVVARDLPAQRRLELPATLNLPLFFGEMFGGGRDFHDLEGAISLRHEGWLLKPNMAWAGRLRGPADRLAWLLENAEAALGRERSRA